MPAMTCHGKSCNRCPRRHSMLIAGHPVRERLEDVNTSRPLRKFRRRKVMKKTALIVIGLYVCTVGAFAVPKDQSWSGWVSDSKCGVKGANASHAGCGKTCIAKGEKPVLVTDSDQKVLAID